MKLVWDTLCLTKQKQNTMKKKPSFGLSRFNKDSVLIRYDLRYIFYTVQNLVRTKATTLLLWVLNHRNYPA